MTNTITNTLPKMPFHFIPQAKSHLSRQILFAHQEFSKVNIASAHNTALGKLKCQSNDHFPRSGDMKPLVTDFLNPQEQAHNNDEFKALKDAFEALKNEYIKFQQPAKPNENRSITTHVESVQEITQNINEKFDAFIKKEKEAFFNAYKEDYPDEKEKIEELWKMYAKNLQKNIREPLDQFTKDINDLVPQALTYYINRLGRKDTESMTNPKGKIKEKLERKLQYTDSNGKPIIITKDKKTGEPSEIRIDPISSLFGSSGNIGDAYAILAAYHGKDVPIRVVVPIFEDDNIYTEMRDFVALLIFLIFAQIYKHLEKNYYLKQAKMDAIDKGISLDNISLVDTQNRPIVFSEKDKAEVNKRIKELESNFVKNERMLMQEQEEKNQKASLHPIAAY